MDESPQNCVGLFGTCGGSQWRDIYRLQLTHAGLSFFDPQVMPETHGRNWCEADIEDEFRHLQQDPILMFKVTGETAGPLSLLEIVKMIQQPTRFIVVLIDDLHADFRAFDLNDPRIQMLVQALGEQNMKLENPMRDAYRSRQWVRKAVAECNSPLVQSVTNDDDALMLIRQANAWLQSARVAALPEWNSSAPSQS